MFVIAISVFRRLSASEIWITFGSGKAFRCIEVHKIAAVLGPQKSVALPAFHALTGCNQSLVLLINARKLLGTHGRSMRIDVTPAFAILPKITPTLKQSTRPFPSWSAS